MGQYLYSSTMVRKPQESDKNGTSTKNTCASVCVHRNSRNCWSCGHGLVLAWLCPHKWRRWLAAWRQFWKSGETAWVATEKGFWSIRNLLCSTQPPKVFLIVIIVYWLIFFSKGLSFPFKSVFKPKGLLCSAVQLGHTAVDTTSRLRTAFRP